MELSMNDLKIALEIPDERLSQEEISVSSTDILAAFFALHQEYTGETAAKLIDIWRFKILLDSLLDEAGIPSRGDITLKSLEQVIAGRAAFEFREEDEVVSCDMKALRFLPIYSEVEEVLGELADKAYQRLLEERGGLL